MGEDATWHVTEKEDSRSESKSFKDHWALRKLEGQGIVLARTLGARCCDT